jgi:hypothetical protein
VTSRARPRDIFLSPNFSVLVELRETRTTEKTNVSYDQLGKDLALMGYQLRFATLVLEMRH